MLAAIRPLMLVELHLTVQPDGGIDPEQLLEEPPPWGSTCSSPIDDDVKSIGREPGSLENQSRLSLLNTAVAVCRGRPE